MKRRTTLKEVARIANVSPATVSRVVGGTATVSRSLRQRVLKAAASIQVDLSPRSKCNIIAFLLSNREMLHPFHSRVLTGAEACCASRGYGVLFQPFRYSATTPWRNLQLPEILERRDVVNAVIVAGTNSQNLLDLLTHKGIPYAVLGNNVLGKWREQEHKTVFFDDIRGSYEMTRYLQSLGHRDIWYVGNCRLPWYERLSRGYQRAMLDAGLNPCVRGLDSDDDQEVGYLTTKALLNEGASVSAIFAGGELIARGVYNALKSSGLHIPGDISVAGSGDIEAGMLDPPLTTIRIFGEQVGKQLAEVLLNLIAQPELHLTPGLWTVPTLIVKRDSCRSLLPAENLVKANREGAFYDKTAP